MSLLPFAIITFALYTVGYPALVGFVLRRHSFLIKEDQLLRAHGIGDDRLTNPHAYDIRKRYSKLYYHFKPDFHFWILIIIARKFLIATTALLFNKNPAFQLAMALLVCFTAYALQVRYTPFMSPQDRAAVLSHHDEAVRKNHPLHSRLSAAVAAVKSRRRKAGAGHTAGMDARMAARQQRLASAVANAGAWFTNYNSVEAVLLCCSVLVCLGGVMFESGQLEQDYFRAHRDTITACLLLVIFGSITYFLCVFVAEMYHTMCKEQVLRRAQAKAAKAKSQHALGSPTDFEGGGEEAGEVMEMAATPSAVNPLFMKMQQATTSADARADVAALMESDGVPDPAKWAALRQAVGSLQRQLEDVLDENKRLKQQQDSGPTVNQTVSVYRSKKLFNPMMATGGGSGGSRRSRRRSSVARAVGNPLSAANRSRRGLLRTGSPRTASPSAEAPSLPSPGQVRTSEVDA
jgi:hypothetical protein